MSWEGKHRLFTAQEAQTEVELRAVRADVDALTNQIPDRSLVTKLDIAIGELLLAEAHAIHARLCRLLPHLTDVVALACFPWAVEMPDDLGAGGDVEPAMRPSTAIAAHYHSAWEAEERNRRWQEQRRRETGT